MRLPPTKPSSQPVELLLRPTPTGDAETREIRTSGWHAAPATLAAKTSPRERFWEDKGQEIVFWVLAVVCAAAFADSWRLGADGLQLILEGYFLVLDLLLLHRTRARSGKTTEADEGILEGSDDPDEVLVEVEIWQNGGLTGVDRGILLLSEDRLVFSGHRSSFALVAQDVTSSRVKRNNARLSFTLWQFQQVQVRLRTIQRVDLHDMRHGSLAFASFESFLKRPVVTHARSELPPFALDPSLPKSKVAGFVVAAALLAPFGLAFAIGAFTVLMQLLVVILFRPGFAGLEFLICMLGLLSILLFPSLWCLRFLIWWIKSVIVRRRLEGRSW